MKKTVTLNGKIHNRFDVFRKNILTGKEEQIAYAENIVLDQYWSAISIDTGYTYSTPSSPMHKMALGRGTGTLDPARTTLFDQIVDVDIRSYKESTVFDYDNSLISKRCYLRRNETQDNGEYYREIGMKESNSSRLVTHALLLDMNGNPVAIEKTETDIITFYSTWYMVFPERSFYGDSIYIDSFNFNQFRVMIGDTFGNRTYQSCVPFFYYGTYASESILRSNAAGLMYYSPTAWPTYSWSAANKKMSWYCRVGAASGNGWGAEATVKGFGEITLANAIRLSTRLPWLSIPAESAWMPDSDIVGESLGSGDGETTKFCTAYPFIHDVTVKIDGIAVDAGDYAVTLLCPQKSQYLDSMWAYDNNVGHYYNPFWETIGIKSLTCRYLTGLYASQDGETWVLAASRAVSTTGTATINASYKNYKYWRLEWVPGEYGYAYYYAFDISSTSEIGNIDFDTAPGLVTGESLGTGDDSEVDFVLDHEPIVGSLVVKANGVTVSTDDYTLTGSTVTFDTAPAMGVAITADYKYACAITIDYTTPYIPKDSDHVFDLHVDLVFGEYVEEY